MPRFHKQCLNDIQYCVNTYLNNIYHTCTGASSGIGAATAVQFARQGIRLALHGRNMERLSDVKKQCLQEGLAENDVCIDLRAKQNVARTDFLFVDRKQPQPTVTLQTS